MPEMPEIQAHAERLLASYGGAVLQNFRPLSFVALKTATPPPEDALGHSLQRVDRRGKYLLLGFGERTFIVHLMQGGRLKPDEKLAVKPRGGVARWQFADGRAWLLTEAGTEHKAGVWMAAGDALSHAALAGLGPEANLLDAVGWATILAEHPMRLHGLLRDQRIVAGLGRRLANEVCWAANISPFANTKKLTLEEIDRLTDAVATCVQNGLAAERKRADMSASKDRPSAVHHKTGNPCPRCTTGIRSVEYRSYTVSYCPTCQTGGRILADNTTSKFLK